MRTPVLLAAALILTACGQDKPPPAAVAHAVVDGFDIEVAIVPSHRLLGEYDKRVDIRQGARPVTSVTMVDPGGFSTVYVVEDGRHLVVVDGLSNGVTIDRKSLQVGDIDPDVVPRDLDEHSVGRFAFTAAPATWAWIAQTPRP